MDNKAIEAAARAAWNRKQEIIWEGNGSMPIPWDDAPPSARSLWLDTTQAALSAYHAHLNYSYRFE
jgi:hypothetical protein